MNRSNIIRYNRKMKKGKLETITAYTSVVPKTKRIFESGVTRWMHVSKLTEMSIARNNNLVEI